MSGNERLEDPDVETTETETTETPDDWCLAETGLSQPEADYAISRWGMHDSWVAESLAASGDVRLWCELGLGHEGPHSSQLGAAEPQPGAGDDLPALVFWRITWGPDRANERSIGWVAICSEVHVEDDGGRRTCTLVSGHPSVCSWSSWTLGGPDRLAADLDDEEWEVLDEAWFEPELVDGFLAGEGTITELARKWGLSRAVVSSAVLRLTTDDQRTEANARRLKLVNARKRAAIERESAEQARIATAETFTVVDAEPVPFPGFDALVLDYDQLQAVMRKPHFEGWRVALSSVVGIYLITDTLDGEHYVGKVHGEETILGRWNEYATNRNAGSPELRRRDPQLFRFSLLRVFKPSKPIRVIDAAESHFKHALDSRRHGMNRN